MVEEALQIVAKSDKATKMSGKKRTSPRTTVDILRSCGNRNGVNLLIFLFEISCSFMKLYSWFLLFLILEQWISIKDTRKCDERAEQLFCCLSRHGCFYPLFPCTRC